jgi:hypothetical protein
VLQLRPPDADGELALRIKLGDALANAGRGSDAAAVYLTAADHTDPVQAGDLRRQSALQSLHYGDVDQGLATLRISLAASGLQLPSTPARAQLPPLWRAPPLASAG